MKEIPQVNAFRENLKRGRHDAGIEIIAKSGEIVPDNKLLEFESDDRFVVREVDGEKNSIAQARSADTLFDELRQFGVRVPVQFIVAADAEQVSHVYAITDRITASSGKGPEHDDELANLLKSILTYVSEKFSKGQPFLRDISRADQYVYGTRPGEHVAHWYLVDTDPLINRHYLDLKLCVRNLASWIHNLPTENPRRRELEATIADFEARLRT